MRLKAGSIICYHDASGCLVATTDGKTQIWGFYGDKCPLFPPGHEFYRDEIERIVLAIALSHGLKCRWIERSLFILEKL